MTPSRYEGEQDWLAEKAMLLDVHDNVVDILSLYCLRLLEILEQFEKAAILRERVLQAMEHGDYSGALNNLRDFVLSDPAMFKLFPQLVDRAEPGLHVLNELADEYGLN